MDAAVQIRGLTEFQDRLEAVIKNYPKESEKELETLGKKLKNSAKDKTPEETGNLKKGYKLSKVKVSAKGTCYITLKNTSPHFHLVEKGHKVTQKKGGPAIGYVPGKHMLETSMIELDQEMPTLLNGWVAKIIGDTT